MHKSPKAEVSMHIGKCYIRLIKIKKTGQGETVRVKCKKNKPLRGKMRRKNQKLEENGAGVGGNVRGNSRKRDDEDENGTEHAEDDSEQDASVSAVNAGIIRLGETIGSCLTIVQRGQPHTAP